jgi:hypothetical protein
MAWVSGFERQRLIERVHADLNRAGRQGKALGRPRTFIVLLRALFTEGNGPRTILAITVSTARVSISL